MTRNEMLDILHNTQFEYIDSDGQWEDIGYTERPIWVNSKGYGYVLCDEPIESGECEEIPREKWSSIKRKLNQRTLTIADIEDTPLYGIVDDWLFDSLLEEKDTENEQSGVSLFFEKLLSLPDESPKHMWWMQEPSGLCQLWFFAQKRNLKKNMSVTGVIVRGTVSMKKCWRHGSKGLQNSLFEGP